ncbi:hypothetical protein [Streptacidiphilus sp. MAP5-52]|uniref:hypothetical protein n=1 Tax=Streptacidiphilus sp. MAP5-52 TaxID=3156267 RepID=UPI00351982AF
MTPAQPAVPPPHAPVPVPSSDLDALLNVTGFQPASATDRDDHDLFSSAEGMRVLAVQHIESPDRTGPTGTYILVFDSTMTWALPGSSPYAGIHLARDLTDRSFRLSYAYHPIPALAQNWLGQSGADPLALAPDPAVTVYRGDPATVALERQLASCGDRFRIVDHHTYDQVIGHGAAQEFFWKTWIIAVDTSPGSGEHPVRVFFEDIDVPTDSYTLRQGGFPTILAAREWTETVGDRAAVPLPPVSAVGAVRPRAAAATAGRAPGPASASAPDGAHAPAPNPSPRRSAR